MKLWLVKVGKLDACIRPLFANSVTYIKSQHQEYIGISSLRVNDITYTAVSDKANILNDQFASVFTREDTSFVPGLSGASHPAMTPVNVTVNGVESLLSNLDQSKAGGPDGLPTRFLKEMATDLAPFLTLILKHLFIKEMSGKKHKLYRFTRMVTAPLQPTIDPFL